MQKGVFLACMTPKWRRQRGIDGDEAEATVHTHGEDGKVQYYVADTEDIPQLLMLKLEIRKKTCFWGICTRDDHGGDVGTLARPARALVQLGGMLSLGTTP